MNTHLSTHDEDGDLLRRFAVTENGAAKYPAADWVESSNVVDMDKYRRLRARGKKG
jgi:hypothetical protein